MTFNSNTAQFTVSDHFTPHPQQCQQVLDPQENITKLWSDQPQPASPSTKPFNTEELKTAISKLKPGQGTDNILAEMIQHLGLKDEAPRNSCMAQKTAPPVWRKAKTIAIPKPEKNHCLQELQAHLPSLCYLPALGEAATMPHAMHRLQDD